MSLPLPLAPSTPTYPSSDDQGLSSVASAHCKLAMFFEHYKFVTFVTGQFVAINTEIIVRLGIEKM